MLASVFDPARTDLGLHGEWNAELDAGALCGEPWKGRDVVLLLTDGVQQAFGPRDQVIEALNKANQEAQQRAQQIAQRQAMSAPTGTRAS